MPEGVPSGMNRFLHSITGLLHRSPAYAERLRKEAEEISVASLRYVGAPEDRLRSLIRTAREVVRRKGSARSGNILENMPLVVEASSRMLGMRPYPVQIMGALAMLDGALIEMQTGEGKTLVAAMAAIFFGWSGRPCHVITVNDYLAGRDHALLDPLFSFCALSTGCVTAGMGRQERRNAYAKQVVYVTAKELMADFLRDHLCEQEAAAPIKMSLSAGQPDLLPVLSGLSVALVDEADCVLIDDAATPLIISKPVKNRPLLEACVSAVGISARFRRDEHYLVEPQFRQIRFTVSGRELLKGLSVHLPPFWNSASRREELLGMALAVREFFQNGRDYIVNEGKVVIVDEFTGRLMPERRWRQGTQQIVELLEGLEMTDPVETAARLSFQRFFRFFDHLCGMSGTVRGLSSELWHIYGLKCIPIPTHRSSLRLTWSPRVLPDRRMKYRMLAAEVERLHRIGRPVLVGTRSIRESEAIADELSSRSIPFQLLNALHHAEEADIISCAGYQGSVTVATNMAGRGTDIKLDEMARSLGGLHVIIAEPNDAMRIDLQLQGRSARQGDPGTVVAYMALDDLLLRRFSPPWATMVLAGALSSRIPGAELLVVSTVRVAQRMSQSMAYRQRLALLRRDDWLDRMMSFAGSGPKF